MPERLDRFMARANAAYYAAADPFADFTTAPEISQVFGEVLGLWAAVVWESMGRPHPVLLVEAGPGRGTLMADALRAVGSVSPGFRAALQLHLIETSPRLRQLQAEKLPDAVWHDSIDSLPDGPLLLLANEFLDALPIRQFVRHGGAWKERYVEHGEFVEIETGGEPADVSDGTIFEICDPARTFAHAVGTRVAHEGGAALFVDYGYEGSGAVDTLQAIRGAGFANPLDEPGSADLTAHVDFQAVAAAARSAGAAVHGPIPQGIFLARLGLFQRTDRLARGKPPREAAYLVEAARRLAEPDRMGRLFKILAICHPALPLPPGFEPEATGR
jgi:NADH dehydrogenase [ubiquinone] 1 alpha subcomplex assembly factor 7